MIGSVDGPGPGSAPPPRLTSRAVMRAALPDHDPADRRAAHRAWLPVTLVNPEVILEVAAAVDPVDTGAVVAQAGPQRGAQAAPQAPDLIVVQRVAPLQRMEPRPVQGFVGVDVPHAGDEGLIEEQRLDRPGVPTQIPPQRPGREIPAER